MTSPYPRRARRPDDRADLTPDERLAALMSSQFGLATLDQMRAIGLSRKMVFRRCERGLLVPCFAGRSGVYRDPAAPTTTDQTLCAAVFAAGAGAYVSHESALFALDLPLPGDTWAIEVATAADRRPTARAFKVHRSYLVRDDDLTTVRGIPVAKPGLALVDLSTRWSMRALGVVLDEALRAGSVTLTELEAMTERLAPAPGRSKVVLRRLIEARREGEGSESVLEDFVLAAIERFGLPKPQRQVPFAIGSRTGRIDAGYPEHEVALEAVGFEWHGRGRARFDDDRFRSNDLVLAGWRVLEFTSAFTDWQIAEQVARALARPVPPRPVREQDFAAWKRRRDRAA